MTNRNVDEVPSRTLSSTNPIVSQVAPLPPPPASVSTTITAPIPQTQPVSLRPTITTTEIPQVPHFGTANPLYGILYSLIPGYQSTSNTTVVSDNVQNLNSPLQGSAPGGNNRGNLSRGAPS